MILQNKLLLFLYDNIKSGEFIKVNHIFTDSRLDTFEIRDTIRMLDNVGFIEVTDDYKLLGIVEHGKPYTIADITIKARLTSKGQQDIEQLIAKQKKRDKTIQQSTKLMGIDQPQNNRTNH